MEVDLILKKLGLCGGTVLKRSIRGLKGFTLAQLIYSLISFNSIEDASAYLGYSTSAVRAAIRTSLIPKFPDRSSTYGSGSKVPTWRFTLLKFIEYKHCNGCDRNLPFSSFYLHTGNDSTNLSTECRACHTYRTKLQKLDIRDRTPSWANLTKIREFYNNCPEGYHVDHIIPLRGEIVSGLHVLENLQYLFAKDNISKGNKWG